jgi:hypothetical protein
MAIRRAEAPSCNLFRELLLNFFGEIVVQAATRKQLLEAVHISSGVKTSNMPSTIANELSFVSQRNHGIDAGGAAGWQETGEQGDRN